MAVVISFSPFTLLEANIFEQTCRSQFKVFQYIYVLYVHSTLAHSTLLFFVGTYL